MENGLLRPSKVRGKRLAANSGPTQSRVTNDQGIASRSYKIKPSDPAGAYSVRASVTYGGQTATSALVPFTVQ